MVNETTPIVIIAENTTSSWSGNVVLFDGYEKAFDGVYSTGKIKSDVDICENTQKLPEYQSTYYFENRKYTIYGNADLWTFIRTQTKVGTELNLEIGLLQGRVTDYGVLKTANVTKYSGYLGNQLYLGNPYFIGDYEDNGMDYCVLFATRGSGVIYVIYRDGALPTADNYLRFFHSTETDSVVLSSGVPNVGIGKIYSGIVGGDVFKMGKLRIEVMKIENEASLEGCCTQPILYELTDANGNKMSNPIYPLISTAQSVKSVCDVDMDGVLINVDSRISISTLPPKTAVKYSFYPKEKGTATGSLLRSETEKELEIPTLNEIEGLSFVGSASNNEIKGLEEEISRNEEQQEIVEKVAENKEKGHRFGFFNIALLAIGVYTTIKLFKSIK